jgi:putative membrane protein
MKNIVRIFHRDLHRLGTNALALVIIAGVTLLPALYAWFNIAANWDPYSNTGGIKVAVANEDAGTTLEGITTNLGNEIVTNLKGNDQIGWQFVERYDALQGVQAGDYYAAIIIPQDFSENMVSVLKGDIHRPTIEYYINEKKNAIAPKITDKGVSAVQQEVNESFLEEVTQALVAGLNAFSDDWEGDGDSLGDRVLDRLREGDRSLGKISDALDIFQSLTTSTDHLNQGIQALLPAGDSTIDQGQVAISSLDDLLSATHTAAKEMVDSIDVILDNTMETVDLAGADAVDLLQRLENLEPDIEGTQEDLRTLGSQLTTLQSDLTDAAERLDELEDQDAVGTIADSLRQLERTLDSVQSAVNKAAQQAGNVSGQLTSIRNQLVAAGQKAQQIYQDLGDRIQNLQDDDSGYTNPLTIAALQQAQKAVGAVANALSSENLPNFGQTAAEMQKQLQSIASRIGDGSTAVANLRDLVESMDGDFANFASSLRHMSDLLDTAKSLLSHADNALEQGKDVPKGLADQMSSLITQIDTSVATARAAGKAAEPAMDTAVDQAYKTLDSVSGLLTQFAGLLPQTQTVLDHMNSALASTAQALNSTKDLVEAAREDLQDIISDLEDLTASERIQELKDLLKSDVSTVSEFMASPVQVETNSLYAVSNYGSAMAPFYSVLACWVGGIVLVAILKVAVDEDDEIYGLKPYERYLGRYLLFLMLAVIQGIIICLGDLFFLGVQCTNIPLFVLSGVVSSLVFSLIIYTLTVSFGDVGKAMAVILLVIQIAGSGGTFPIEVTPAFFQKVNPILPFTHAINAMREIVAGQYGVDYWLDLLKLLVFIPLALLLGLVLRKPLIRMNEFFEERLNSTKLM